MRRLLYLLPLVLTGCVAWSVPRTTIDGSIGGSPFHFSGPKDVLLGSLNITANTNGTVSIAITNLSAKMNPDVITTTGAAQTAMIKEIIAGIGALMQSGGPVVGMEPVNSKTTVTTTTMHERIP